MVDRTKIDALATEGFNRASIASRTSPPRFRPPSAASSPLCDGGLRGRPARGGHPVAQRRPRLWLPHQSETRIRATVEQVLALDSQRVALYGYAHVPWCPSVRSSSREVLPKDVARYRLALAAGEIFQQRDSSHWHRPFRTPRRRAGGGRTRGAAAAQLPGLHGRCLSTLIGMGASSISRFPGGYVQNAPATAAWAERVLAGRLAGAKGHAFNEEDRLRARAIEMLMCDFRLDLGPFGRASTACRRLPPTSRPLGSASRASSRKKRTAASSSSRRAVHSRA
jgi:oxygen-independent coproporphyrinogen-3 oxidase